MTSSLLPADGWPATSVAACCTALFVFILCLLFIAAPAHCEDPHFGTDGTTFIMGINRPVSSPYFRWTSLIYEEVFNRLGIELELVSLPVKRASIMANNGAIDGEPGRIRSYGEEYTNLVRIQEPVFNLTIGAYAANASIPWLQGWDSLKGSNYSISFVRGIKFINDNISRIGVDENVIQVSKTEQGLDMLDMGYFDIFLADSFAIDSTLAKGGDRFRNPIRKAGIMEEAELYMYVHKRKAYLADQLASTIKAVREEGLVEKFFRIALQEGDQQIRNKAVPKTPANNTAQ